MVCPTPLVDAPTPQLVMGSLDQLHLHMNSMCTHMNAQEWEFDSRFRGLKGQLTHIIALLQGVSSFAPLPLSSDHAEQFRCQDIFLHSLKLVCFLDIIYVFVWSRYLLYYLYFVVSRISFSIYTWILCFFFLHYIVHIFVYFTTKMGRLG